MHQTDTLMLKNDANSFSNTTSHTLYDDARRKVWMQGVDLIFLYLSFLYLNVYIVQVRTRDDQNYTKIRSYIVVGAAFNYHQWKNKNDVKRNATDTNSITALIVSFALTWNLYTKNTSTTHYSWSKTYSRKQMKIYGKLFHRWSLKFVLPSLYRCAMCKCAYLSGVRLLIWNIVAGTSFVSTLFYVFFLSF